jgi:hypothetical protein
MNARSSTVSSRSSATVSCSFKRPRHQAVARLLEALNADRLRELGCYFGVGTAIALQLDEFRESADIDFLCADKACYRALRELVFESDIDALFRQPIAKLRETRADMDGIRNFIVVDSTPIKFEIVAEGRIPLGSSSQILCGVTTLCTEDMFTEKLLANTDRGLDRSTASRDLIDLLALSSRHGGIPSAPRQRAAEVYGQAVLRSLQRTCTTLREDRAHWNDCIARLGIDSTWEAILHRELLSRLW